MTYVLVLWSFSFCCICQVFVVILICRPARVCKWQISCLLRHVQAFERTVRGCLTVPLVTPHFHIVEEIRTPVLCLSCWACMRSRILGPLIWNVTDLHGLKFVTGKFVFRWPKKGSRKRTESIEVAHASSGDAPYWWRIFSRATLLHHQAVIAYPP